MGCTGAFGILCCPKRNRQKRKRKRRRQKLETEEREQKKDERRKEAQKCDLTKTCICFPFYLAQVTESRPQPDWSCVQRGLLDIFRCYALVREGGRYAGFRPTGGTFWGPFWLRFGPKIDLKSMFANLVIFAPRAGHSSVLQGRRCENESQNRPKVPPGIDFEVFGSVLKSQIDQKSWHQL